MTIVWILVFVVSLVAVVKGSDWLLDSAEKIAVAFGLSSFFVGVLIVGMGTSLPELVSAIAAVAQGVPSVVTASATGSNFTNILLVIGFGAVIGRGLSVSKNLIDSELPMLVISTMIFLGVAYDGFVSVFEAVVLVLAYVVYIYYTFQGEGDESAEGFFHLPRFAKSEGKIAGRDYLYLVLGAVLLAVGANYLINSLEAISRIANVAPEIVTLTALAFGTSLPELVVSSKAALRGQSEVAIGNIFGSCAFNILMVVGIPALLFTQELPFDEQTFVVGVPALALATLALTVSGISRSIYHWEGAMYLLFYVLVIFKLVGLS